MSDLGRAAPQPTPAAAAAAAQPALCYASYLKLDELTQLQQPLASPGDPEELLFITVHQTHELWFKQMLCELGHLDCALQKTDGFGALVTLERLIGIQRLLLNDLSLLEVLRPNAFRRFRSALGSASGIQSRQFRQIQVLCGGSDGSASIRTTALAYFRRVAGVMDDTEAVSALLQLYELDCVEPVEVAEKLTLFDELAALWRFRHLQIVERMIGRRAGTGSTSGVEYLSRSIEPRFFPELWEFRNRA